MKSFHVMMSFSLTLLVFTSAQAKPVYVNLLSSAYSTQLPRSCTTCHATSSMAMNPFGKDFSKLKGKYGPQNMDKVWPELGQLDSDQDSMSNFDEIKAKRQPGIPGK